MTHSTPQATTATPQTDAPIQPTEQIAHQQEPSFADLNLAKPILEALTKAGYTHPTPIQAQAIPPSLAGRDLLLSAQTGSGKTAAFVLPILHRLASDKSDNKKAIKAVILTPTRELALQVQDSIRTYSDRLRGIFSVPLVGGADYRGQIRALTKGVQIVVATPGRFIDHLQSGRIDLSQLDVLVLDEADRMLDMGFSEDIDTILKATPNTRQTIMSSATWDGAVGKIAEGFTTNPERIAIKVQSAHIDESVYFCDDFSHKNAVLRRLLESGEITQAVIFTSTKLSTERLADDLCGYGYNARYLHGDLPQGKRNRIVSDVKAGKCQFLIATDVAARGIDIATISHVINYDLPRQAEDYVHRIGRSGRAGRSGVAYNLCSIDDKNLLSAINRYLSRTMTISAIEGLEPVKNTGLKSDRYGDTRKKSTKNSRFKGGGKSRFDDRKTDGYRTQRTSDSNPRRTRDDRANRSNDKSFNGNDKSFNASRTGSSFGERATSGRFDNKPYAKKDNGFKDRNFKDNGFKGSNFKESGFKSRAFDSKSFKDKPFKDQKDKSFGDFKSKPKGEFRAKKQPSESVFHTKKRRFGDE